MKQIFIIGLALFLFSCNNEHINTKLSGQVFGTSYSVIYDSDINFEKQFDSLFYVINKSMSTYIENSDISKINRNEAVEVDEHFANVFNTSKTIYDVTSGAFDPTIGAVVNAWDFGPEGKIIALDSLKIDSLMLSVGLDKVKLRRNAIQKENLNTFLDFEENAIPQFTSLTKTIFIFSICDILENFIKTSSILNKICKITSYKNSSIVTY